MNPQGKLTLHELSTENTIVCDCVSVRSELFATIAPTALFFFIPSEAVPTAGPFMKILIIHSDSELRNNLKSLFEGKCFSVDAIGDIRSGFVSASVTDYAVIIVEHALPQCDAEWFCRFIRDRERTMPILVLATDDDATGLSCLENGADDFVRCPFSMRELFARTQCLARRPRDVQPDIITIEHVTIDCRARIARCGKREVPLTQKEFMILEFLALNRGTIVSKSEIIEHNWSESDGRFLNATLDTHIYRIRKKIERRGRCLIHNVMRRGYRIG